MKTAYPEVNESELNEEPAFRPGAATYTAFGNTKGQKDAPPVFPPLPDPIILDNDPTILSNPSVLVPHLHIYSLNVGCYLVKFQPIGTNYHYDGTIRVQKEGVTAIASGDLYYHKPFSIWPVVTQPLVVANPTDLTILFGEPNPANGIPIFSRKNYRYYLRITQILGGISLSNTFTMSFQMWKFNGVSSSPMWTKESDCKAEMTFTTAPAGYPSGSDYLTGTVKNAAGSVIGTLVMGQVSKYLRRATVEIDRVSDSESPLDSGVGHTWQSTFDKVGWQLNIVSSNNNVTEVSGDSWSDGEMHAAMLKWRDSADLDSEWRYHILAVNLIDSTPRGIMYDAGSTDSNNVPREGIGIASHWIIPNANPWGTVKGVRFGLAKAPYFRTALHEIGHAMGLYHNTVDFGIMNTTDVIAASAPASTPFPANIKWEHASDDQKRLRHMPDIFVRPGGIPFGTSYSTHPISDEDEREEAEGLEFVVKPLLDVLPIGAPVRCEITLTNTTAVPLPGPASLDMKKGNIKGRVTDPSGTVRTFSPLVLCVDEEGSRVLQPDERLTDALTLLRGGEGALFPSPGIYTIEVEVEWEIPGGHVGVSGGTNVYVTAAKNDAHAQTAMQLLSTPDTLLSLVLTGDHLTEGNAAIQQALDNPVLRPHYAYIEAKRLAKQFGKRKPDLTAAASLLDEKTVMSCAEIKKAAELFPATSGKTSKGSTEKVRHVLLDKAKDNPSARGLVSELADA